MPEKVNGTKFSGKSNIESLNSNHSPIDSKSAVQLNSTEHKLATLQKMADNSPYSQRFAQLKSLANKTVTSKQPVSQLSKDSHSLPDNVKHGVESLSGISMDDVKVHYNSAKPAQLNAHAYAQGTDIHIASGQEKHLPHEAWHVVQQKQGRVQPTTMMKAKVPINDDQGLEKEADVMGARALQGKFVLPRPEKGMGIAFSSKQPTQLVVNDKPKDNLEEEFNRQQDLSRFASEPTNFRQVNPMYDAMHKDEVPEGSSNNELKKYVTLLNIFLDDIMEIDFADANSAKKNNDYLHKLELISYRLNQAGVLVGITSVLALGAVSGGLGPLAVIAAGAGALATQTAVGVALSGGGLAVSIAKNEAQKTQNAKETAQDVGREGFINSVGNNVMGTEQAGIAAGMRGGADLLGGVTAGTIGALFAAFGLKSNMENFSKLAEGKKAIIETFNSIGETLVQVELRLLSLGQDNKPVDDLIKPILPKIYKTTAKIRKITAAKLELPAFQDIVEM
jgi:hypothetical protein